MANPYVIRLKIGSAVDGYSAENFRHPCTVAVHLVNKVAGPVQCVPRPDQLSNFISKYFSGQVLCLYLPTLGQSDIFGGFVVVASCYPLLLQLMEKLG